MSKRKVPASEIVSGRRVSARALQDIMLQIRETGLPDALSRHTIRREIRQNLYDRSNCFGPLIAEMDLPDTNGDTVKVFMQSPLAMLDHVTHNCPEFFEFFEI